ncbi:hypothetical protein IEO21_01039 [Rhodonia placenta]|uniref:HAUS augmin-like complex subunit 6 N-terminal domain-containing protein n=1 Tax=Rhodonia placenta TaxID=104341 RepID=A0A8H7PA90_9APHY|nr:hypothetical protein IEO21_01039 [Postia placenta]
MEDICYFLIGKIGGGKDHARSILPTYPCLQPSDTTAFRISLSKYLEALRHSSIYPSHAENKAKSSEGKRLSPGSAISGAAWWKDVVVRRSLLEECCGNRFERLILALSTHALLKCTLGSRSSSPPEQLDSSRHLV